ncbi:hypothetical protein BUALT_Bualt16G0015300 [Buddleja alternifolia]|uniref:Core-2/I-branching beta-1,6-N-acetylglucosaminyltransferase family protein n=1 Tax=Buddleja alternifolia TaxID=168488 RepID=A0AAV6WJ04_9LAMI|nr:hypothetical protein BUALT_Bualt16G0015300 [Buddleja alternifolia]
MMMRRSNSQKFHHRWKRKILAMLLLVFCLATFVLMESQCRRMKSLSLISPPLIRKPKIAFLFIARNRIPLDMVWDAFFQVDWGEASMIQAERVLLENALRDSLNERFLFLSDSCIPLYDFSYTYEYIMSTSTSFVDSFADTKESRYNPKMHPVIPVENWRKGSQPADGSKEHNCIPDEHYVQTLLAQKGLERELTRRSLTHSSWDLSSPGDPHRRGWHPMTYKLADATPVLIRSIKDIDNINYETEYRREWCTSKGKPSKCFLFARKFTRPAALRLLNMVSSFHSQGSSRFGPPPIIGYRGVDNIRHPPLLNPTVLDAPGLLDVLDAPEVLLLVYLKR